jgi:hypothetical protein
LEIFNYEHLSNYDNILYLDSDIIIVNNISDLFDKELDPNLLYVKKEDGNHNNLMHSLCLYTDEQLLDLKNNNINVFSCGHFMFKNSLIMKNNFNSILNFIKFYTGPFFYEQSFMNHYFNLKKKTNTEFLDSYIEFFKSNSINYSECIKNVDAYIVHVCCSQMPIHLKLHNMKQFFNFKETRKPYIITDTRNNLPQIIKLPDKPHIVEIGVFNGEFSEILLNGFKPYMLYLIDSYEGDTIVSGDKNGNNVMEYNSHELKTNVLQKFSSKENVILLHSRSTILQSFPDNSMDLIYIDGDHTFDGVLLDLNMSYQKIKPGGWICGHDYDINTEKCNTYYDFGIKKAVSLFCFNNCLKINILCNDGCISYAICVLKL